MKRTRFIIALMMGFAVLVCTQARGEHLLRWTDGNPPTHLLDPTPVAGGTFTWANPPYIHSAPTTVDNPDGNFRLRATIPDGMTIAPGAFRAFSLENTYVPTNLKRFWISFRYEGAGADPGWSDFNWGYHPDNGTITYTSRPIEDNDTGVRYSFIMEVDPQPDWERINIKNYGTGEMTIFDFEMGSLCFPAPAGVGLLAFAGVVACRRHRR